MIQLLSKQLLVALALGWSQSGALAQASMLQQFTKDTQAFLARYASQGSVDYALIKKQDQKLLALVEQIAKMPLAGSKSEEKKSFYLNAYNILVIKGITDKYPIEGPLKIPGFFDQIRHEVGGEKLTLNEIENERIRQVYKDARIHFALVCAARGCPKIRSEAYWPQRVEAQLEEQTKQALNDPHFIKPEVATKKVLVSEIFKWYEADFLAENASILAYLNRYRTQKLPATYQVDYYTYDWKLNSK
ncbi:MAG: DUF547 domain-containing protein [Cytophagales bacterium]|nr:DUF547 domain-containing protein [Cytophagales bacterium]